MVLPKERRKNKRAGHETAVALESLEAGAPLVAKMFNFSRGGLYFESNSFISPGKEVFLGIAQSPYSRDPSAYECHRVKIKWMKELYDSPYRYGYGVEHRDAVECFSANGDQSDINGKVLQVERVDTRTDSRKHPRKALARPVYLSAQSRYFQGLIKDISRGGIFVETDDRFSVGQVIKLVIPETKFDKNIMIRGEIVRLSQAGVGIKFTGIYRHKKV